MLKAALGGLLLWAAGLHANPDLDGHVHLGGGMQLGGLSQKGSYPDGPFSVSVEGSYKTLSTHGYGFEAVGALTEWLSVQAGLDAYSLAEERFLSRGPAGTYRLESQDSGQRPSLGFTLYPAAWTHGLFVPGLGNPDGPLNVPVLSVGYRQGSSAVQNKLQVSGDYVGVSAPKNSQSSSQGFALGFAVPVFKRLTVFHQYNRTTWLNRVADSASVARSHPDESLYFGARLFSPLQAPAPLDPAEYLPRQGRPGGLRVDAGLGWSNSLDGRSINSRFYWVEARHALDSRYALSLRFDRQSLAKGIFDSVSGFKPSEQILDLDRVLVGLHFNLGSPRWRGKPIESAVDAKPQGIPSELPEPESTPPAPAPETAP